MADHSEGCWEAMPAEREDEICRKALELLSDLCSKGEVQDENCNNYIYYFRDLARPRYTDSGQSSVCTASCTVEAENFYSMKVVSKLKFISCGADSNSGEFDPKKRKKT